MKESKTSNCDMCAYYDYDDELECYVCGVNMDEDDVVGFMSTSRRGCPYFVLYDEYKIVRKQN